MAAIMRKDTLVCLVCVVITGSVLAWRPFNKADCKLPASPGPCSFGLTRYYFDDTVKACKRFSWTGCGGNVNQFKTVELCIKMCGGDDICHVPPPSGDCGMPSERFCFDKYQGICAPFNFTGCTNSLNSFPTLAECQTECKGRIDCVGDNKPH